MTEPGTAPSVTRFHHFAATVDSLGVENSGVIDTADPMPYSVVVFRDPGNIQLELIHEAG